MITPDGKFHRAPIRLHSLFAAALLALAVLALGTAKADASSPAWSLKVNSAPTYFVPGAVPSGVGNLPIYDILATNVGGAPTSGPIVFTDTLPDGLTPESAEARLSSDSVDCNVAGQQVSCITSGSGTFFPGQILEIQIHVKVSSSLPEGTTVINSAAISGGGPLPAEATNATTISSSPPPFDFTDGSNGAKALLTDADGTSVTQAGSRPFALTVDLALSSQKLSPAGLDPTGGGVRDVVTELPPGIVVNPTATPVRCAESQLETNRCPLPSQVGTVTVTTFGPGVLTVQSPMYNMDPPPGTPAMLAFDALGIGLFVHLAGGVRSGDYALTATSNDILARGGNPVFSIQAQLWGDPSDSAHNSLRGTCIATGCEAEITPQQRPFLTMPTACSDSLGFAVRADSWQNPGTFVSRNTTVTDAFGNSPAVSGCGSLPFNPSIDLDPSSSDADSAAGMDVSLKVPQTETHTSLASGHLKKAVVTLPEGMTLNPSAADGLEGCTEDQIGLTSTAPIKFDLAEDRCPDGSKVGTATIHTPLLPDPLQGELFLADPGDNPFDTLLSGYLVAKGAGLVIKIAGQFDRDPVTGQITAVFDNNPQQPFSDLQLHFKGGSRGVIATPSTCGIWTVTTDLSPWSAADPTNPTAAETRHLTTPIVVDHAPGGAPCTAGDPNRPGDPADASNLPFNPAFSAGTVLPSAGSYSPLVTKISRADGQQAMRGLELSLPPGLTGKLAGVESCSDAALAAAAARTGAAEQTSPSCPSSSRVGSVDVGAGVGATPFHVAGTAYLGGPYKGAPLSIAVITPALAGPFDLGTVVVRAAAYVDPASAQIRIKSDAFPAILDGIPLHVRSVTVLTDRERFTLNPTSCEPMRLDGTILGSPNTAAVSSHFQVGGCRALDFDPKLSLSLQGGTTRSKHPALKAVLTARPGEANIARAQVTLPHSEFLDQGHIKTICTRVQFAVDQCPPGSIYGRARAITPLLDRPLEGPVYLRSSNHLLPDLVATLHGQIDIELVGRIDSVKGGIRTTFEGVPDAPVSKFVLKMQGGKKGLLVNSTNLCARTRRAKVQFDGQNGAVANSKPVLKSRCGGKHGKGSR